VPQVRTGAPGPTQLAWFHVESMSHLMGRTAWVVLTAVLALASLALLRIWSTRRVLARRTGFVVLPTDTFAPTRDAIRGWGQVLAGTRRLVRGRWTRRARAVRIVLGGSAEDSRLVVQLHADPDALRRLQVPWFGEVELRRVETEPHLVEPLLPDRLERDQLAQAGADAPKTPRRASPRRRRPRRAGGNR
jgi:hypothetical protein